MKAYCCFSLTKISSYLNKPAAFNTKPLVVIIIASLLVCFLLGFFQPFGIAAFNAHTKCHVIIGYTLVTAVSTSITVCLLPCLFKKTYNPAKWTIAKSITNNILIISLIALGNAIFDWSIGHHLTETFGSVLLSYILVTSLIGIIPASVSILIVQNHTFKKNLYEAEVLNNKLEERLQNGLHTKAVETDTIVLAGETKEIVTLYPGSILYIESLGNYVKVSYLLDGAVKRKQLRNTISRMTIDLQSFPYLVRCHRAYMVNISYITNVEGNSRGLQLYLQHIDEAVPVSRSYVKTIREKI